MKYRLVERDGGTVRRQLAELLELSGLIKVSDEIRHDAGQPDVEIRELGPSSQGTVAEKIERNPVVSAANIQASDNLRKQMVVLQVNDNEHLIDRNLAQQVTDLLETL